MRLRSVRRGTGARALLIACLGLGACATSGPSAGAPARVAAGGPGTARPRPAAQGAAIGAASCAAAFDSLEAVVEHDYAGYAEKARGHEAALAGLADSVRAVARTSDDYRICIPAMQRFTRFFRDPHMLVWQAAPPPPSPTPARAAAVLADTARATRTTAAAPDPDKPTLQFAADSAAVVRVPSFSPEYKGVLDSLVSANRSRLLSTPTLVVDLRGNGGGCTCAYDALAPLVYDGPFSAGGQDLWTSPANVAFVRGWLTDNAMPETFKESVRRALPLIEGAPNSFVPFPRDTVVRLDSVYPMPRNVAVLVDGGCASSCEDFVLMARQSAKVTVVGPSRTAGVHDYGNVRAVWLPGWRRLRVPTSRSRRLPAGAIDNVGLAPDVWVPAGTPDTVRFARRAAMSRPPR